MLYVLAWSRYRVYVKGCELTISLPTITTTLNITLEVDYEYPVRSDHLVISLDGIVSELFDGRWRTWSGESSLPAKHLTLDYHLLHLAIVAYITSTATKKSLPRWCTYVLYGVGTGRVCLVHFYILMFFEPSRHTSPILHLKGAWFIHHLCEVA